jgi:hypothetical protein
MAVTLNANTSTGFIATSDTSGVLQLQTGGTTAVTVSAAQNVGIGTSSPLDKLDVVSASSAYRNRFRNSGANESVLLFQNSSTGTTTTDGLYVGISSGMDAFLWNYENNPVVFGTNNTERMRILSTGNILSLSGGSTTATGTGIAFPAVFNASSDVNTLDDYEEGSWSPTFSGFTIGNATGIAYEYVKIGRICLATVSFVWGSTSTSSGDWGITLPFTAANSGGGAAYALDNGSAEYAFSVIVATGTYGSTIKIGDGTGAGLLGGTTPFTWASGDRFQLGVTYMTA